MRSRFDRTGRHRVRFHTPEIAHAIRLARKHDMRMADGLFYNDLREPHFVSDLAAVTLATTDKALYTTSDVPNLAGYFLRPGKKVRVRLFGKITTAATPGNLTIDVYWGSGADATGTIVVSSAAFALTASQTNLSWECEVTVRCITKGSSGSLRGRGIFSANVGVVASTLQPVMIPASANADVSVDLSPSANNIISVQAKRSGSTAETMTVQDLEVIALC
jgi:hypothetical protein